MDIYIYETGESGKLSLKGITDRIRSVSISRRFFSGDSFKAVFSGTERNRRLIAQGRIIEIPSVFSGYITGISLGRDKNGCGVITAEGSSFDGMLSRRVLSAGEASDSFMTVLDKNAGEAAEEERRFPCTYFDKDTDCGGMLEDGIIYENLGTYVTSAGRHKLFGVGSEIVHESGGARIRIYGRYGADRSILQEENEAVVLSDSYGNVTDISRSYNENGAVNGAFIYSEEKVNSKGSYLRYLCHLDSEDKQKYDVKEVRSLNGAKPYEEAIEDSTSKYTLVGEMVDYISDKHCSFAGLVDYSRANRQDWFRVLVDSNSRLLGEYIRSKCYSGRF